MYTDILLPYVCLFYIGRFVGSILGGIGYTDKKEDIVNVHFWFAVSACIIAVAYFILYHAFLKPRYAAPVQHPPTPSPAIVQSMRLFCYKIKEVARF